ncbi:SDR family NAD(P)-dependent oxidoreductase [Mycobacterium sp. CVI_P3]|uniref:SDR family NAD(P)-dependent oxidoreductase n=1 Tax=Mycobacterium pinniadriaticum TaxID=2994102 RepID=A0ABT3S7Y1_9MYCO|nr:SDR family oxidoreductase [Mycobacterium pinniadriaticum]MCX2929186.1 SDR family NAD(P)-dependent oxidoreductase [Mycobacterium pinniadriaticum]MCX2935611.1 SDR family NAD(P)-dependent oxidoreductase [Mycobacterium pinniadriaticum]
MSRPLDGRRAVVTGAASGLGAAAVRALVAAGAHVVATYHRTQPTDESAATWLPCDARDPVAVDAMVDAAVAVMGGLDVLVNAAGLWHQGIPGSILADDIDFLLATNVKTAILTNQAAHAVMRKSGGGRIINFGSAEAVMGSPISAVYAASKGAVQAWTRSAAKAWAADNVTVNALAPAMQTRGADRLREFLGPEAAPFIDQQIKATIPLGGALGDPDRDLGPVLVFLAGEGSHFITGQLLPVDGGLIMVGG